MSDARDPARRRDDELRAYLLGTLGAERRASIEEQIFEDEAAYDALLDARYDLLDDYARDVLPAAERDQVAGRLLGEAGEAALAVADRLARRERSAPPPSLTGARVTRPRDWRRLATAAVAVLAVGAAARVALENARLRNELSRAGTIAATRADDAGRIVRVDLVPRTTRSAVAQNVTIPAASAVVEVVVAVDDLAPEYRVTLEGSEGALWTGRRLPRAPDGALHLWLAAAQLPDGVYELLVYRGVDDGAPLVAAIPFRLARTGPP